MTITIQNVGIDMVQRPEDYVTVTRSRLIICAEPNFLENLMSDNIDEVSRRLGRQIIEDMIDHLI